MNNKKSQQNKDNKFDAVCAELLAAPKEADVKASFQNTMKVVTNRANARIHIQTHEDVPELTISMYIMSHIQKTISVSVAAAAFVFVVGYTTYSHQSLSQYEDLLTAALDENESYVVALDTSEDDFSDLADTQIGDDLPLLDVADGVNSASVQLSATPEESTQTETTSSDVSDVSDTQEEVNTLLTELDSIFADDDIDDSELETWFADDSASDGLIENYDI